MYCENCGSKVEDTAKFCTSCGAPLKPAHMKKPESPKETEAVKKPEPMSYHDVGVELPKKNNNKKILILLICLCVVLVGAVVGVLLAWNHDKKSSDGWEKSENNKTVKTEQPKEEKKKEPDRLTEEDAEAYVQACLDASYKGDFSEYILMTGSSREEAKAMYEGIIENTMAASDIESSGVSQDLIDRYRQLFTDLYKRARYEITNVTRLPDGEEFELEVTVWPFTVMQNMEDKLTQALDNDPAFQTGDPSETEINQIVYQKMYDIISAQMGSAEEYGAPIVVTVRLELDGDEYHVPDEDYVAIDNALIGE